MATTTAGHDDTVAAQDDEQVMSVLPLKVPSDPTFVYPVSAYPPRSQFQVSVTHPALIIPARRTAELRRKLSHVLMHRPKLRDVYALDETDPCPKIHNNNSESDRSQFRKIVLKSKDDNEKDEVQELLMPLLQEEGIVESTHVVTLGYEHWSVEQILRQILPLSQFKEKEVPSSFEIVGHVAHMNLRDECLPFAKLIGTCILDKNSPRIQTVVNKLGSIANEYRTFDMAVIAGFSGDDWSLVKVKEEKSTFEMDFRHVYWNSRLCGEHRRLVKWILSQNRPKQHNQHSIRNNNDHPPKQKRARVEETIAKTGDSTTSTTEPIVVADVMAGVGPFAVPLATRSSGLQDEIAVHANDLNPMSYKYLKINAKTNKCGTKLIPYNMDGRAFVHAINQDPNIKKVHHFIMNLPASAPEFLNAFAGYQFESPSSTADDKDTNSNNNGAPWIHVYCFGPKDYEQARIESVQRCEAALGCPLEPESQDDDKKESSILLHVVRDVSPRKNMLCVSFRLPEAAKKLPRISL
jgi:tRNA (guanine37-N1)-methyltransferase